LVSRLCAVQRCFVPQHDKVECLSIAVRSLLEAVWFIKIKAKAYIQ
jgi:hypothetical protein